MREIISAREARVKTDLNFNVPIKYAEREISILMEIILGAIDKNNYSITVDHDFWGIDVTRGFIPNFKRKAQEHAYKILSDLGYKVEHFDGSTHISWYSAT